MGRAFRVDDLGVGGGDGLSDHPREDFLVLGTVVKEDGANLQVGDLDLESIAPLRVEASLISCLVEWSSSTSIRDVDEAPLLGKAGAKGEVLMTSSPPSSSALD